MMHFHTSRYLFNIVVVLKLKPSIDSPFLREALSCFLTWEAKDCILVHQSSKNSNDIHDRGQNIMEKHRVM